MSGKNAAELEAVSSKINELLQFLSDAAQNAGDKTVFLSTALGEAMINVARHAYPKDFGFVRPSVGKWWATASADRSSGALKVVIFDQGATIPITFPRKRPLTHLRDALKSTWSAALVGGTKFDFVDDGTYIHEAMQPGMTQTGEDHRGLGLPEMVELIGTLKGATMTVYSRGGVCHYDHGKFSVDAQDCSIGGTLIEWTLHFADGKQDD